MSYTFNPFIGNLDDNGTPLDLASPGSIGSITPSTGAFTTVATNSLQVHQTANLSTVNINGAFNFGEGEPALEVTQDRIVLINTLSAVTISATQIVGFDTYDQSLNTTDSVAFAEVTVGDTVIGGSSIGAVTFGRGIDFEDGSITGDYSFEQPINFSNTTAATGTRANLGLDSTDTVNFYNVNVGNELTVPVFFSTDQFEIQGETGIAFTSEDGRINSLANLGVGSSNSVQFASITGNDITLINATVQPGETLTSSISSLIVSINGQQYKLPLLPI